MRRELQAVAAAALEWNRARLRRIAVRKALPADVFSEAYMRGYLVLDTARTAEAKAKAALRRACEAADPRPIVLDVQAHETPLPRLSASSEPSPP